MKKLLVILLVITLQACSSSKSTHFTTKIGDKADLYKITDFEVVVANNAKIGSWRKLDDKEKEENIQLLTNNIKKMSKQEADGVLIGAKPAKLEISLNYIKMASKKSQVLVQKQSILKGHLKLIDNNTKEIISETDVTALQGSRKRGNVGSEIAMVSNIVAVSQPDRTKALALIFAKEVRKWLIQK